MRLLPTLVLLLTLNPITGNCQPPATTECHTYYQSSETVLIKAWISAYANKYHVDPAFATAVAHVESRKGQKEFRTGRMGPTYYGPMGIHKCFRSLGIDRPEKNIEIGVKALRNVGGSRTAQRKRLKRYNATFNPSYWKQIKQAEAKYKYGF